MRLGSALVREEARFSFADPKNHRRHESNAQRCAHGDGELVAPGVLCDPPPDSDGARDDSLVGKMPAQIGGDFAGSRDATTRGLL
ncbi:MAG: hypothetical protein AAF628_37000 [Planctomycetota bacterium]